MTSEKFSSVSNDPMPDLFRAKQELKMKLMASSVLPLIAIFIFTIAFLSCYDKVILKRNGLQTMARVISTYTEVLHKSPQLSYVIGYQFQKNNDSEFIFKERVTDEKNFQKIHVGDMIPIIYDPSKPSRSDLNLNDSIHTSDPYSEIYPIIINTILIIFFIYTILLIDSISTYRKKIKLSNQS
jgi:hypothetical protein